MTPKRLAFIMVAGVVAYMLLAGWRGVLLIAAGGITNIVFGISVIVIPCIGAYLVWREIAFGMKASAMGKELSAAGLLDVDDLPRTPSGRIEPAAATARFELVKADVEADPENYANWYRLAVAYEDARDRKAARGAMRKAFELQGEIDGDAT